jgi:hypothetical protein
VETAAFGALVSVVPPAESGLTPPLLQAAKTSPATTKPARIIVADMCANGVMIAFVLAFMAVVMFATNCSVRRIKLIPLYHIVVRQPACST